MNVLSSWGVTTNVTRNRTPDTSRIVTTRLTGLLNRLSSRNMIRWRSMLRMGTFKINAMAAPRIKGQAMLNKAAATSKSRV